MPRDHQVRTRIAEYLANHGPVADPQGRATAVVKQAVGYKGTDAGFTQLIAAMAKAELLTRHIRGRRTYRISGVAKAGQFGYVANTTASYEEPVDYEQLAAILLGEAIRVSAAAREPPQWARRRVEQLEARNAALVLDLACANEQARGAAVERDALRKELEGVQRNLELLTEPFQAPSPPHGRAAEQLSPDDQILLDRLRQRQPQRSP
jgi:hypothetical protein